MSLRPVGATCFVQPDRRDRTERGLFLPVIAQDDACAGVVIAVGEGFLVDRRGRAVAPEDHRPPHARQSVVRVGDRIAYAPEQAQEIPFGYGADAPVRVLLDQRHILAVLPPEA